MMLTRMLIAVPAVMLLFAAPVRADDPAQQDNMEIVRAALRADKKALVATNLQLTDAEAKAFWPVYDRYEKDLLTAHNQLYQVVQEFAAHYDKLTNEKALELVERYLSAEEARAKVRRSYLKEISKVLPGLKVARFYQIENKIDAVVRYEMAGSIPLAKQ
jgi:phage-related minor tail protein